MSGLRRTIGEQLAECDRMIAAVIDYLVRGDVPSDDPVERLASALPADAERRVRRRHGRPDRQRGGTSNP